MSQSALALWLSTFVYCVLGGQPAGHRALATEGLRLQVGMPDEQPARFTEP